MSKLDQGLHGVRFPIFLTREGLQQISQDFRNLDLLEDGTGFLVVEIQIVNDVLDMTIDGPLPRGKIAILFNGADVIVDLAKELGVEVEQMDVQLFLHHNAGKEGFLVTSEIRSKWAKFNRELERKCSQEWFLDWIMYLASDLNFATQIYQKRSQF